MDGSEAYTIPNAIALSGSRSDAILRRGPPSPPSSAYFSCEYGKVNSVQEKYKKYT